MREQERTEIENGNYSRKKKRKRLKKWPFVILALIILGALVMAFIFKGYQKGLSAAKSNNYEHKIEKFNGKVKNDGKATVMILGADREDGGISRTDSIMIAQYDYIHKDMKVVSVMRDIYAEIPGYGEHKINSAYSLGGPELLRQTLKKNLDIDPEYYAILDFKGFEQMIDELSPKGIPIDVEKDMSEKIGVSLTKGHHRLNGKELLGYARFRNDEEGDFGRVRRQQQVMKALKKELISPKTIYKGPKLAGIMRGYVNTDMPDTTIYQTGLSFVLRGSKDIDTLSVPAKGTYSDIQTESDGSALQIDKEQNKEKVRKFLGPNDSKKRIPFPKF
ncbi:LCP family protein [Staphylococcus massiliensis]|uniref:LCP family protein n=1 Tax=Staphylococcus massiliensis TaxID=555791 RepID=UPI001EDEE3C9|nr:LCP family protein [Staphylococcus massiliensis]MCG3401186.1 LCP family protein [Staphylococcus massiliensis]